MYLNLYLYRPRHAGGKDPACLGLYTEAVSTGDLSADIKDVAILKDITKKAL